MDGDWRDWTKTTCAARARKLAEVACLDVYAPVPEMSGGKPSAQVYWYPTWVNEILRAARDIGFEERAYRVICRVLTKREAFLVQLRTAVAEGAAATRALLEREVHE